MYGFIEEKDFYVVAAGGIFCKMNGNAMFQLTFKKNPPACMLKDVSGNKVTIFEPVYQ